MVFGWFPQFCWLRTPQNCILAQRFSLGWLWPSIFKRIEKYISLFVCKLTHPILVDSVRQGTPVDKAHPPFQSTVLQHKYPLVEVCYHVPLQCAGQPPFPPAAPHRLIRRIFHTILCKPIFGHTATNPYAFYANKKSTAQFPAFCLFTDEEIRRTPSPLTWFIKFSPDIQHSPFPTVTLTSPLVIGNIDMSVGNSSKKNLREHYPIIKDNRNPTKSVADLFALFSQMLNKLYSVAVGILLK